MMAGSGAIPGRNNPGCYAVVRENFERLSPQSCFQNNVFEARIASVVSGDIDAGFVSDALRRRIAFRAASAYLMGRQATVRGR